MTDQDDQKTVPSAPGSPQAAPIRGTTAERYIDRHEIARGGMGVIRHAFDPSLQRSVAIKSLLEEESEDSQLPAGAHERFLEEAQVMAQLDHPGVLPVHELGVDSDGGLYFTMPLVRGETFHRIIDRVHAGDDDWSLTRAVGILQRACEAIAFAHSRSVVHRDLKPANIMVGAFGEAYVMDWGLARVGDAPAVPMKKGSAPRDTVRSSRRGTTNEGPITPYATIAGDVIGTPAYMAPEQSRGDLQAIAPATDVFSLGAILYHLLVGHPPYGEDGKRPWKDVLEAALIGPPTPIRQLARSAPAELVSICEKAMQRDPRRRYGTASELGDELRAFLENRVVRAHATGAVTELRKWIQRNRMAAAAAALAIVSLFAGLAVSIWQKSRADHQAALAEASYLGSLDAVEAMLGRVAGTELEHVPGAAAMRRRILEDASALLERFVAQRADRDEARFRVAKTWQALAQVSFELGDEAVWADRWRRAGDLYEELMQEHPDSIAALRGYAESSQALAEIADRSGDFDGAVAMLERTIGLLDAWLATHEQDESVLAARAVTRSSIAERYWYRKDPEPAVQHAAEAWKELEDLVGRPDIYVGTLESVSAVGVEYAGYLIGRGRANQALPVLATARAAYDRLLEDDPDSYEHRARTASMLFTQGNVLSMTGQPDEGTKAIERSIEILQSLVHDFPANPTYWSHLGGAFYNLSVAAMEAGDPERCLQLTEKSTDAQLRAVRASPDSRVYAKRLRMSLHNHFFLLLQLDRYAELVARVDLLHEHVSGDGSAWFKAGGFLWDAAKYAQIDEALNDVERTERCNEYMRLGAVKMRKAKELGHSDPAFFASSNVDPLREHPTFVEIQALFGSK